MCCESREIETEEYISARVGNQRVYSGQLSLILALKNENGGKMKSSLKNGMY